MLLPLFLVLTAALARTGGPDAFGYTFTDSDEVGGPTYAWTDIRATGLAVSLSDGGHASADLPFSFWFYGIPHESVQVAAGALVLGSDGDLGERNACLPTANRSGDEALILPLWDDLDPEDPAAGGVVVQTLGSAPDRHFVIQYDALPADGTSTYYTFQVILEETTQAIVFQYASVLGPDAPYTGGAAATVGIQGDRSTGLDYACDLESALQDGLAIRWDATCEDLDGDGAGTCDGDCDDSDPTRGSSVAETDNGADDDCDGLVDEDFVSVGDILFSELMPDPNTVEDTSGEWFEVHNSSPRSIDLQGWVLSGSGGSQAIDRSLAVPPDGYALFSVSNVSSSNGGLPEVDFVFDRDVVALTNTGAEVSLRMGAVEMDAVRYLPPAWSVTAGVSLYLDPSRMDPAANDAPFTWCLTPMDDAHDIRGAGTGDWGTPRSANPEGLCCFDADGDGASTCDGDCDDADPNRFLGNPEAIDGQDNDCDGFADEEGVVEGYVRVTEFMDDPTAVDDALGEWFEVWNPNDVAVDLLGWKVWDANGEGFTIETDLVVPPGEYALFATNPDATTNGLLPDVDYVYPYDAFILRSYDDDEIFLSMGDLQVDALAFANAYPWESEAGRSMYLCPGSPAADPGAWRVTPADPSWAYGLDYGTPGAPTVEPDLDGDGVGTCTDCDESDPSVYPGAPETCDDGRDNNCDGAVDAEDPECQGQPDTDGDTGTDTNSVDSGPVDTGAGDSSDDTVDTGGKEPGSCGCGAVSGAAGLLPVLLAMLASGRRRQRR